jgi:hypothetical protein
MALTDFHRRFQDSVRWRLTPDGLEIEGSGIERTTGSPMTVTRVWENYAEEINRTARARSVPCALIVATICTESRGNAGAIRLEPGYKSDETTPNKVSPGLMQTLISTARSVMKDESINRAWLMKPANSIDAGAAVIAGQFNKTGFDPPLVAAAYNSGGIYEQKGERNRWKLRQYPIGTSAHCDRFIQFFNDAVFVLKSHSIRPAVGLDALLGTGPASVPSIPPSSPGGKSDTRKPSVMITFGPGAKPSALTPYSRSVLEDILRAAGLSSAVISSTQRTPAEQARVMYENLESQGVARQKELYGRYGDMVIDVYIKSKKANRTSDQIKADMEKKIVELGPTNVSHHTGDPKMLNVFDVQPSSIRDRRSFENAVRAEPRVNVKNFLMPPADPGYHIEIPQKQ